MKTSHPLLAAFLLLYVFSATAQQKELPLFLKNGTLKTANTISTANIDSFNTRTARFKNKVLAILQFENLPAEAVRKEVKAAGIELLDYIPKNAYLVNITGKLNHGQLQKWGARTLIALTSKQKMHPALASGQIPGWAIKVVGTADVQIHFLKSVVLAEVMAALKAKNMDVVSTALSAYQILTIRIAANRLEELAAFPFILYVQPALPKDQSLNLTSRISSRGSILNTPLANGGRGLNGAGIVMGIGDNADVQFHADFSGRLINRTSGVAAAHGTHVHGTAAGGGIINEQARGYAPKATIVSQDYNGILANAPLYVQDYGMVITNNSYGVVAGCDYNGYYDIYSYILDQQAFDYPNLQHVFAAGNSGTSSCAPYPLGFHTVLGSYQSAKNVISVANADYLGNIASSSSKGPVADGRIKPEITAMGEAVYSSIPTNTYGNNWGTSMASPAVSGGLALLYQRYRQLKGGANPANGLMKALLCNGATDKGNPGPDYTYGFGFMNLERSVTMLEANRYISSNITNGGTKNHTITVPANTAQLKVMLYWNDPAPAYISSQALVNDLDLKVINSAAVTTFPKILNPAPAGVTTAAAEGADHINNIEQVVISSPSAGIYTLNIQGSIAQNPSQDYYIVYDFIPVNTQLVFPAGGTVLKPGEATTIAWDSYGAPANTFSLEYSTNNGVTWNTIATGIAATARQYAWTAPAQTSDQVLVNIKRDGTSFSRTSDPFTIIGTPTVALDTTQCEGYMNITWSGVTGATDYELLMLRGSEMMPVATTTDTSYSFNSLSKDSIYWVGVRARINGKAGRRSLSLSRLPNSGSCSGAISDNDLKLNTITAPVSGREYTASALGTSPVKVEIKNLDDAPTAGFTVSYKINNRAWVFENVTAAIAPGALYTHTFGTTEDFTATGIYNIIAVVKNNTTDLSIGNDTVTRIVKHIANPSINFSTPFTDDMEAAPVATYTTDTAGLTNLERYDFKPGSNGRLRTFINSGVALSGAKAIALDVDRSLTAAPYPVQYLTGTYNLSGYGAAMNDIRLQYNSINGCAASAENKVWVRGSDMQPWIEVYAPAQKGFPITSPSIEIAHALNAGGQDFTTSFQVRWGAPSSGQVISQSTSKGLMVDDVSLYQVFNDMQLVSIDTPYALSCGLSNAVPVAITLRNSSNAVLTNVPVKYSVDNGATWVSEIVASIAANTTIQYLFTTKADLSLPGVYGVIAEVNYASDSYSANNSQSVVIYNSPTTTVFPYLQNFETGNGGWYTDGSNASWEYGTPASANINRAASGAKAWKTSLSGNYNDNEYSYLYSPCFAISGMTKPTISFSVALDLENCGANVCDAAWVEYSVDNKTWYNLADLTNAGTNWYSAPLHVWTVENYTTWHVATMPLPTGYNNIRFRFVLYSDGGVNREGIAIDDIHIYDNTKGIYSGATMASPVTKAVNGNNWIDFESGGKLVASILPSNQNLGATDVQAYLNSGAVRFTSNDQYYHNRNITIKPTNRTLATPATVRFYFLDTETNTLLNAENCSSCSKPASAYDLGISKYSAANSTVENGTINDNNNAGTWSFIPPANVVKVPFDKGYYAEFQVQSFSEFWLNNGSFDNNTPLPVHLIDFTVKRNSAAVVLDWTTADEQNVDRYEIELARTNNDMQKARFEKIGSVESKGNSASQRQYNFTDEALFKSGVRYYRLKIIDTDGAFRYSAVRSVLFSDAFTGQVYPNPSTGIFHFVYQAAAGDKVAMQVEDATGRMVQKQTPGATGFLQKIIIDLTGRPAGVYLLQVRRNGKLQSFKLYKQ